MTRIRPATRADTPYLAELSKSWAEEGITIGQDPDTQDWFEAAVGPYFLVAEIEAEIVGFVQGEEQLSGEQHSSVLPVGTRYLDVTNVYVVPRLRSGGVGGALLDQLLAAAARRGIERSMVYSAASELDRVMAFYRSHGFRGGSSSSTGDFGRPGLIWWHVERHAGTRRADRNGA